MTHLAGRLLTEYPDASPDLLRALIVAHSSHPEAALDLLERDEKKIYHLLGYGRPDGEAAILSSERNVTLLREDSLGENEHHFYEIPLPEDFLRKPTRRGRRITVALAHTPLVRRTRLGYRAGSFQFRVVRYGSLQEVINVFRRTPPDQREEMIPEAGKFRPTAQSRSKGTAQAGTWNIRQVELAMAGKELVPGRHPHGSSLGNRSGHSRAVRRGRCHPGPVRRAGAVLHAARAETPGAAHSAIAGCLPEAARV